MTSPGRRVELRVQSANVRDRPPRSPMIVTQLVTLAQSLGSATGEEDRASTSLSEPEPISSSRQHDSYAKPSYMLSPMIGPLVLMIDVAVRPYG